MDRDGGEPGHPAAAGPRRAGRQPPDPHLVRALEWLGNGALREYLLRDGGLHLPHPPGWPSTWPGRTRLGAQMAYLLAGLPLAVVSGVVVLVGLVLGASTFVIWIGLPITVGLLAAALGSPSWSAGPPRARPAVRSRRTTTGPTAGAH